MELAGVVLEGRRGARRRDHGLALHWFKDRELVGHRLLLFAGLRCRGTHSRAYFGADRGAYRRRGRRCRCRGRRRSFRGLLRAALGLFPPVDFLGRVGVRLQCRLLFGGRFLGRLFLGPALFPLDLRLAFRAVDLGQQGVNRGDLRKGLLLAPPPLARRRGRGRLGGDRRRRPYDFLDALRDHGVHVAVARA